MKYSRGCSKIAYNSEQEAWEYVIHNRRQNKSWTEPYLCKCGNYHTTGKHFNSKNVPAWVKQFANDRTRLERDKRALPDMVLPLQKQKEAIAKLPKIKPEPSWKITMRQLLVKVTELFND